MSTMPPCIRIGAADIFTVEELFPFGAEGSTTRVMWKVRRLSNLLPIPSRAKVS